MTLIYVWWVAYQERIRSMRERQGGAVFVEYALLLAFIAALCIGAVAFIGVWLDESFTATADRLTP